MERNYYPRAYRNGHVVLVHCLNVDKQYMPNTSYSQGTEETLWSVRISISPALRSVASRVAALEFGMGDMWFKSAVI